MAKAKQAKDQHKSGFMVRLPESYRGPLEELKKKNRRALTVEVQIALDKHFKDESVKPATST